MATQACDTRNTVQNATRDIIDNQNVAANIDVPRGCCLSVAVENTSGQAINFANANLIVERVA